MAKKDTRKEILVYADWIGILEPPALLGILYSEIIRGKEIFSFDYDNPMPPESIRFPYPITDNSLQFYLLKELYGPKKNQTEK